VLEDLMRRSILALLLVTTPALADSVLDEGVAALPAVTVKNLSLIPLVSTEPAPAPEEDVATLDEGMKARKVKITEVSQSGSVGTLRIDNKTGKPLFLMAGEVVLGGKQDRIVGKNTLVPAGKQQDIPVFCVEHGRWNGRKVEFSSAGVLAHKKLRTKASFKNQGEVWDEVKAKNAQRGTANATDTYRQVAAQQAGGTLAGWEKEVGKGLAAVPEAQRKRMVGMAIALNGEVVAVDVFASPALYAKLSQKIVRSYITEAIDAPIIAGAKVPSVTDVRGFLDRANAAPEPEATSYESDAAETVDKAGSTAGTTKVIKKGGNGKAKPVYQSTQKME
jgi:hypothetical protein